MRLSSCVAWTALVGVACLCPTASAQQGTYSGKTVYGLFGPRVLGQTLQSPVRAPQRGIARDQYGNFLGVNQAYSGRMFGGPKPGESVAAPAVVAPPLWQPTQPAITPQGPELPAAPDEWLRSQGGDNETAPAPPPLPVGPILPDSSRLAPPAATGGGATVVGFAPHAPSPDPFARRLSSTLERTTQIKKLSPIRVDMRGETAVLRGRVATRHDRELAENLVRLEPGVSDVRNELAVGPARPVW